MLHCFPNRGVVVEENDPIGRYTVHHKLTIRDDALAVCAPDKVLRAPSDDDGRRKREGAEFYHRSTWRCREQLIEMPPLHEEPANRPWLALPGTRRETERHGIRGTMASAV